LTIKDKLKSYNFWITLVSAVILLLQIFGDKFHFSVDSNFIMDITTALCSIFVILGIITVPKSKIDKTTAKTLSQEISDNISGDISKKLSELSETFNNKSEQTDKEDEAASEPQEEAQTETIKEVSNALGSTSVAAIDSAQDEQKQDGKDIEAQTTITEPEAGQEESFLAEVRSEPNLVQEKTETVFESKQDIILEDSNVENYQSESVDCFQEFKEQDDILISDCNEKGEEKENDAKACASLEASDIIESINIPPDINI